MERRRMSRSSCNDYYSGKLGYIIEGITFRTFASASCYLQEKCFMETDEASHYLTTLARNYHTQTM